MKSLISKLDINNCTQLSIFNCFLFEFLDKSIDSVDAVALVKAASEVLGGQGGGGRPDMAQAGGADFSKADEAIKKVEDMLG